MFLCHVGALLLFCQGIGIEKLWDIVTADQVTEKPKKNSVASIVDVWFVKMAMV